MSNDWDLGTRLQSEDRVHRIGQDKEVDIIDICALDTIDERILKCLWKKESLLDTLKKEVDKNAPTGTRDRLKRYIYGSRYDHGVFDCSELED